MKLIFFNSNSKDPISLQVCKRPVRITTSDGQTRIWDKSTVLLACKKQGYVENMAIDLIIEKVNSGSLFFTTPRGCFNFQGGAQITCIRPF